MHDQWPPLAGLFGDAVDLSDRQWQHPLASNRLVCPHDPGRVRVGEVVLDAEPVDHPQCAEDVVPPRLPVHTR
jgi:hypothetical protein